MLRWVLGWFFFRGGDVENAPTEELMRICEAHWEYLANPPEELLQELMEKPLPKDFMQRSRRYERAVDELGRRGPEIRGWARQLLRNPENKAREQAALWMGELGTRGRLGETAPMVVNELTIVATRAIQEDDIQVLRAAVWALDEIESPRGTVLLQQVLLSSEPHYDEKGKETVADVLGELVGEPFEDADDPVEAARAWLQGHLEIRE